MLLLDVWRGRDSGPYMHALHFMFGMGAFLAPVLGRYTMHLLQSLAVLGLWIDPSVIIFYRALSNLT